MIDGGNGVHTDEAGVFGQPFLQGRVLVVREDRLFS
jgi:hypothetical protein